MIQLAVIWTSCMHKPLYHLSFNATLPHRLFPRTPANIPKAVNGVQAQVVRTPDKEAIKSADWPSEVFAEHLPSRISFSESIEGAFLGIWPNISHFFKIHHYPHMDMYVYQHIPRADDVFMTPEELTSKRKVWDAHLTREYCFFKMVRIKRLMKIRVMNNGGGESIMGRPFDDPRYDLGRVGRKIEWKILKKFA